ncbi:SMP-30/gluconolactonase/LRE family protein [Amycolatopsis sp. NPDC059657]|uniref:SMP-30/gluconolactonase/LRE family protein n=1 Tax=Amycolatopsis sp. NPDC059657 TaxID=3346899 RepID=UPI003672BBA8
MRETSGIVVEDERLAELVDPTVVVERLGGGATWSTAPLWLPGENAVIWSDVVGNRVLRWTAATGEVTVESAEAEFPNGRARDHQGRVVTCSHGKQAIERAEADGTTAVLVDRSGPARLTSPSDVVVASDGAIWFTDPRYGVVEPDEPHCGDSGRGADHVYRLVPETGELTSVLDGVEEPNGLAFSPDERRLYVSDTSCALRADGTGAHCIRVYDVTAEWRCVNGRLFAEVTPGVAEGFCVDVHGNVWTASAGSVQVYAPDGTRLGTIPVPQRVGHLCFGGTDGDTLFIAASTSLYRLRTTTRGNLG